MEGERKRSRRSYSAPKREAAAERTQAAILAAAKTSFEERGWAGATVRHIAAEAAVSPKTVEAIYGTKAKLLAATVTYAIRGDVRPLGMLRRAHILAMEDVPTAAEMLERHAEHLRRVNERSAGIAFVVEQAARTDAQVRLLWDQMNHNRRVGVRWATRTLLSKPQTSHLEPRWVKPVFLVAFDWGTYRVLTEVAGLSAARYEDWLKGYYRKMFLRGDRSLHDERGR
jgi:AcrR family transcriptional regulator